MLNIVPAELTVLFPVAGVTPVIGQLTLWAGETIVASAFGRVSCAGWTHDAYDEGQGYTLLEVTAHVLRQNFKAPIGTITIDKPGLDVMVIPFPRITRWEHEVDTMWYVYKFYLNENIYYNLTIKK